MFEFDNEETSRARRGILGMGMASMAAGLLAPAVAGAATEKKGAKRPLLFQDGVWNRETNAMIEADITGKQVFGTGSGIICGVRPGERTRTLFNWEIFSTIRVVKQPDGSYDRMSKEVILYTDAETGDVLEEWDNPYTNERVKVVHVANDPFNWIIREYKQGQRAPGVDWKNMTPPAVKVPFVQEYQPYGPDTFILREGGHGYYKNLLDPKVWPRESSGEMVQASELFRYFIRREDLENPKLTHIPTLGSWTRLTPWLPWMLMGQMPGMIVYDGSFTRYTSLEYFKPKVLAYVRAHYPQYMEAPTKWYGPSISSLEHYVLEQKPAPVK